MAQPRFDFYTKIVLNDVKPRHKRAVKFKDELIPFERNHFHGKGVYKRIQIRYNSKQKRAILIFLGYDANSIFQAIQAGKHPDFDIQIDPNSIDYNQSGMITLMEKSARPSVYHYALKDYIPFSGDSYKVFDRMRKAYLGEGRVYRISHPSIRHLLLQHLYLHVHYLQKALLVGDQQMTPVLLQINDPISHKVDTYKSKESSFEFTFTSNTWLPEDLNIGNHTAYGFGQLKLLDKYD